MLSIYLSVFSPDISSQIKWRITNKSHFCFLISKLSINKHLLGGGGELFFFVNIEGALIVLNNKTSFSAFASG